VSAQLETGDMLVVTVPVPTTEARELQVWIEGAVAHVHGPGGFCREVNLSEGADGSRLQAGLFADILELRAPRVPPCAPRLRRGVDVRSLN
jgi:HSP20 family molecular chaperone IbpA